MKITYINFHAWTLGNKFKWFLDIIMKLNSWGLNFIIKLKILLPLVSKCAQIYYLEIIKSKVQSFFL
jgi:hypothetical protein